MANVNLENIIKKYGNIEVLKNINLKVDSGEFMVLVGPSGCGKSTLLRSIAGLEEINCGKIFIDNLLVNNISPSKRDIAFVFQTYALYPQMSVYENIAFPLKLQKIKKEKINTQVLEVCRNLNLENFIHYKPKELSGGQRQRVALGRAIIRKPKVFLMDEPLSNLDAKLRSETRFLLKKLHQELKTTFIYVTHDQTEAMTLGNRVCVMNSGEILQIDTPQNIYDNPTNTFVAGFMGNFPMNLIDIKSYDNKYSLNGTQFNLPFGFENKNINEFILGLRVENMFCYNVENSMRVKIKIDFIEILGDEKIVYFKINEKVCKGKLNSHQPVSNVLELSLNVNDFLFFDKSTLKRIN